MPGSSAYSRFVQKLRENHHLVREIFEDLVGGLYEKLEGLGQKLAIDGKAIQSHAAGLPAEDAEEDGRRNTDADYGVKIYYFSEEDEGEDGLALSVMLAIAVGSIKHDRLDGSVRLMSAPAQS